MFYACIYLYRRIRYCNHSFYQKDGAYLLKLALFGNKKRNGENYPIVLPERTILELYVQSEQAIEIFKIIYQ